MNHTVVVIDGMGGGIGSQLVAQIRNDSRKEIQLLALATNAVAAQKMVDAGAMKGASGENAFRVVLSRADFILGPMGIVLPDSMMGEVTPEMAECVMLSQARKILVPLVQPHLLIAGLSQTNVGELVEEAVGMLLRELEP